MLGSNLCYHSDACIVVKRTINVEMLTITAKKEIKN